MYMIEGFKPYIEDVSYHEDIQEYSLLDALEDIRNHFGNDTYIEESELEPVGMAILPSGVTVLVYEQVRWDVANGGPYRYSFTTLAGVDIEIYSTPQAAALQREQECRTYGTFIGTNYDLITDVIVVIETYRKRAAK